MEFLYPEKLMVSPWYLYLDERQKQLVKQSLLLYERELSLHSELADYSFLVFTMSKAYEGFLKKFLRDLNFISTKVYEGRRFRIGRALNPDIHSDQRDEYWLYDDLARVCGEEISRQMWDTWLECRNRIFHYFPQDKNLLTFPEAEKRLVMLIETMEQAVACKRHLDT